MVACSVNQLKLTMVFQCKLAKHFNGDSFNIYFRITNRIFLFWAMTSETQMYMCVCAVVPSPWIIPGLITDVITSQIKIINTIIIIIWVRGWIDYKNSLIKHGVHCPSHTALPLRSVLPRPNEADVPTIRRLHLTFSPLLHLFKVLARWAGAQNVNHIHGPPGVI